MLGRQTRSIAFVVVEHDDVVSRDALPEQLTRGERTGKGCRKCQRNRETFHEPSVSQTERPSHSGAIEQTCDLWDYGD